jgi:hypothetical protein
MQIGVLIIFILFTSLAFGQSLNVDNIYNFSPSKLKKSEQEKKLPALDGLWNKVKSDTTNYLPLLRNELNTQNHNPFFYYDGAALLLSLTKNDNDKTIAAKAIAKCDLADIDHKEYVITLNRLANEGIDVTTGAIKILSDTSFSFFIPQHVMNFSQDLCLTYMLLPEKRELYIDTLLALFKSVLPPSQESIIKTLWFAYSCRGDSLIAIASNDKYLNEVVRKTAKKMISVKDLSEDEIQHIQSLNKSRPEEFRKELLRHFSDEAADELIMNTIILRKDSNCR